MSYYGVIFTDKTHFFVGQCNLSFKNILHLDYLILNQPLNMYCIQLQTGLAEHNTATGLKHE